MELQLELLVSNDDSKENKDLIDNICKKINKINSMFKKYNLLNTKIDLKTIIDSVIMNDNYSNLAEKQIQRHNEYANRENNDLNKTINYLDLYIRKNSKTK